MMSTYHVSPATGSDTNDGSDTMPLKTVRKAQQIAGAGDVIRLLPGNHGAIVHKGQGKKAITYSGVDGAVVNGGGAAALIINDSDEVIVEGIIITNMSGRGISARDSDHLKIRNCNVHHVLDDGIFAGFCSYLLIEGCTVDGSSHSAVPGDRGRHGIYVSNSATDVHVLKNTLKNTSGCCVQFNGDPTEHSAVYPERWTGWVDGGVIADNVGINCGRNGGAGSNFDRAKEVVFQNNLYYWTKQFEPVNKGCGGIACYDGTHNVHVVRSTIWQPSRYGVQTTDGGSCSFEQSIVVCTEGAPCDGNVSQSGSKLFGATGYSEAKDLFERPEDPGAPDFRLRDASLAIGWSPTSSIDWQ
jgi:hypothetical protein